MNPLLIGALSVPFLLILLLLGVHVGIGLGLTGFLGFWLVTGNFDASLSLAATTSYKTVANYPLVVLPFFILMGIFAGNAGLAEAAYRAMRKWTGALPGGLAIATTMANAVFGAACGSSVAACVVFTKFSLPEMKRHGYQLPFAAAAIASAGLLAMLIPPSVLMIVYGILTEQSIGALFIAGIFPGILLAVVYAAGIIVMVKLNPTLAPQVTRGATWKERLSSLSEIWGIGALMLIVLGGIYAGIFTPTEAGGAAAFGAFIIALVMRKVNWSNLNAALLEAGRGTALVFFILIGAMFYSKFLAVSGITNKFVALVTSANLPPLAVLSAFLLLYLLLGCFLDSISMMTITLPLVFPVSVAMHWHPIWFAIVVIMVIEMGLVTPPMGMNVFVVKAAAGEELSLESLFLACVPFFILMFITLALIIAFPAISTWLPSLMWSR